MTSSSHPTLLSKCLSEFVGTAALIAVGLSIVIFDFAKSSPVAQVIPSIAARRALTGALFGATGTTIALSKVGKVSGAHINPVVSLAFWAEKALPIKNLMAYIASQLAGAVVGSVPLLAWGAMGKSVDFAATQPGSAGTLAAFAGEMGTTFVLIVGLLGFVDHRRLRKFTPFIFPPMYAFMVWIEAAYSGTSTNPARSLGPDVITLAWHSYWLYWAAPVAGTVLGLAARKAFPSLRGMERTIARRAYFELEELETHEPIV
jgi:aquaporin Z